MRERTFVHLEGFGKKYRLWSDGELDRWGGEGYVEVSTYGSPPRVTLYRLGQRYRPYLHTLLRKHFGD